MLQGINPLLTGALLRVLDEMGHGDSVLLTDAHYPAYSVGAPVLESAAAMPELLVAVCEVLPIDNYDGPAVHFMTPEPDAGAVQDELRSILAVGADRCASLERFEFYDAAKTAFAVVRTAETRTYANVLLRKGVVTPRD